MFTFVFFIRVYLRFKHDVASTKSFLPIFLSSISLSLPSSFRFKPSRSFVIYSSLFKMRHTFSFSSSSVSSFWVAGSTLTAFFFSSKLKKFSLLILNYESCVILWIQNKNFFFAKFKVLPATVKDFNLFMQEGMLLSSCGICSMEYPRNIPINPPRLEKNDSKLKSRTFTVSW